MVPVGELPEASDAEIVEAVIALPLVPLVGAVAESVVDVGATAAATTVSGMPTPQVDTDAALFESPVYDAYHQ